jgi:hypothetical protein
MNKIRLRMIELAEIFSYAFISEMKKDFKLPHTASDVIQMVRYRKWDLINMNLVSFFFVRCDVDDTKQKHNRTYTKLIRNDTEIESVGFQISAVIIIV